MDFDVQGERNGRGTFVHFTGYMFFGEYVDGVEHGRGVFTELDFGFFDGVWVDGKRHGAGVCFPNPGDTQGKVRVNPTRTFPTNLGQH